MLTKRGFLLPARGDLPLLAQRAICYAIPMRSLFTLLFSAILALTSVTLALAQHAQLGATTLVLCSDSGPQHITLDAQGNPLPAGHSCPECLAALAAQDLPPAWGQLHPQHHSRQTRPTETALARPSAALIPPQARGPPV